MILGAETGFRVASNPDTVLAPDVAFIQASRIGGGLPKGYFPGPPDLAVEVLSPNDRASEVLAKVQDWLSAGCAGVWVVDPKSQTVTVYGADRKAAILTVDRHVDRRRPPARLQHAGGRNLHHVAV